MTGFHVGLTVGALEWDILRGDVPTMDDLSGGLVMDGLSLQWAYGDGSGVFPDQPQPVTLSFQLLFEDSKVAVDYLLIGMGVSLEVFTAAYPTGGDPSVGGTTTYPTATFTGRIGAVSAAPDDFGVLYTVVCVDVTAELGDHVVGDSPWPAETMLARVQRIGNLLGLGPLWTSAPALTTAPVAARDVDGRPALELLAGYLRQWPYDSIVDADPHRLVLIGQTDAPVDLYQLAELPDHITAGRYPGRLHDDGTISFDRAGVSGGQGCWVLDAGWLDFAAVWTQTKGRAPNTVVVTGPAGTGVATTGERPAVSSVLSGVELTAAADMALTAKMYLPDTTQQGAWTVDKFRLWGDLDGVDLGSAMLMLTGADDDWTTGDNRAQETLCGVVVIDNIPARQSPVFQYPDAEAFYAGRLTGATLGIEDGRWFVDFTLRPDVPRPPANGDGFALTFNDIAAELPALTINEVDPVYTIADTRLLGRAS